MYPSDICVPCLRRLARQTAGLAADDEKKRAEAVWEADKIIDEYFPELDNSAKVATLYHREIKKITGNPDPFRSWKIKEIEQAKKLFARTAPKFEKVTSFLSVLKLSVLGNSLDFFCSQEETEKAIIGLQVEFQIDDSPRLTDKLTRANRILLLADNAGEVFFDLPLYQYLDRLGKEVSYVIKGEPIQNDITLQDLKRSGLERDFKKVVTNQSDVVGFHPDEAGPDFRRIYEQADLIIAKGMGHLEALGEMEDDRLFYLLKAKCQPIADFFGVAKNVYVLRHSPEYVKYLIADFHQR